MRVRQSRSLSRKEKVLLPVIAVTMAACAFLTVKGVQAAWKARPGLSASVAEAKKELRTEISQERAVQRKECKRIFTSPGAQSLCFSSIDYKVNAISTVVGAKQRLNEAENNDKKNVLFGFGSSICTLIFGMGMFISIGRLGSGLFGERRDKHEGSKI